MASSHSTRETPLFESLQSDVLLTHILPRLDAASLAAASCASSQLHELISGEDNLWRDICASAWPSTNDPLVRDIISGFPYRRFVSGSFRGDHHHAPLKSSSRQLISAVDVKEKCLKSRDTETASFKCFGFGSPRIGAKVRTVFSKAAEESSEMASSLWFGSAPSVSRVQTLVKSSIIISAVDVRYRDRVVFSKVIETEIASSSSNWFRSAPFRIDALEGEDMIPFESDMESNLLLSWILIDPERARAWNVSSARAVSVQPRRRWSTALTAGRDDMEARFSTVVDGRAEAAVVVVWSDGGGGRAREMSVTVEDLEGRKVSGEEGVEILLGEGRREGGKKRYEEWVKTRREWRERKERKEWVVNMACMYAGFLVFFGFWCFLLYR